MFNQLNVEIFNAVNQFAGKSSILDKVGILTAEYLLVIFLIYLITLWFSQNGNKNFALYSGYSLVLGILLNFLITLFYFHPRPFMENNGKLLIDHAPNSSFPSDHTTFMLSIALMFLYFEKTKKMGILLSVLGLIGGFARVYCGLHYPFDVLGSLVVAIISSGTIFVLREKLQKVNHLIMSIIS